MIRIPFFVLLSLLLLCGCSKESSQGISEQEAIRIAVESASMSRPELGGSQTPPTNLHAEQMTLAEAVRQIDESNSVAAGYSADMPVWLVTMEGNWLNEAPRLTDVPTPEPYHRFLLIIDAKTGSEIESAARP